MALKWPVVGIGHAPAYQVAGVPWVTSSVFAGESFINYGFDQVTKYVQIHNTHGSNELYVAFSELGLMSSSNYITVDAGTTRDLDVRCTQIFLSESGGSTTFDIMAGLTAIPTEQMPILTASNGFSGVG